MTEQPVIALDLAALNDLALRPWLRPIALLSGSDAARAMATGTALPLAGGPLAFGSVEILVRQDGAVRAATATLAQLRALGSPTIARHLAALSAPRAPWAGFAFDRPLLMGIVNVTPDSFSDGGAFADPARAIAQGRALRAAGADILDIGGESTRPGAVPVAPEEERRRVEPVIRALAGDGAIVSVDTRSAAVMAAALDGGARIVNDVTALAGDRDSLALVARRGAAAVLMHMQGEPATMQKSPRYTLTSLDVVEALAARIAACVAAGIPQERLVVDPGIGFGKAPRHNLELLKRLTLLHGLGCGVMIGLSRKSLIGNLVAAPVGERLPGSLAGALSALSQGVQILRVHDVAETRQAMTVWRAIAEGG
jgi:dihydropteroate synthase